MTTTPTPKTWDAISEKYSQIITIFEIETASFLQKIFHRLKINRKSTIAEIGSGSGHISLILKKKHDFEKITLLDFSEVALYKSKKLFDKHNLECEYLKEDILKTTSHKQYDVTWNSGVMEHFDNDELQKAIKNIYKMTKSYYILLVPNPTSFIYRYYRFTMTNEKKWDVGTEFLRKNYSKYLKKSGFKVVEIGYFGKSYSINQANYSFKKYPSVMDKIKYMFENNMFDNNQLYLKYYICKK